MKLLGVSLAIFFALAMFVCAGVAFRAANAREREARVISEYRPYPVVVTDVSITEESFNGRTRHRVSVAYEYTVAGRLYQGTRAAVGVTSFTSQQDAAEFAQRCTSAEDVFVDPTNPERAVLLRDEVQSNVGLLKMVAAISAVAGIAVIVMVFVRRT